MERAVDAGVCAQQPDYRHQRRHFAGVRRMVRWRRIGTPAWPECGLYAWIPGGNPELERCGLRRPDVRQELYAAPDIYHRGLAHQADGDSIIAGWFLGV